LGATASSSYILSLCGEIEQLKLIFEKTSKSENIQENDKDQKCSFGQSHNSQNQHRKSQQDQAKKKRNTKFQTQVCV
jgi:hypothetical protein